MYQSRYEWHHVEPVMEPEAPDRPTEHDVLEAALLAQHVVSAASGDTDRVAVIDHGHTSVVAIVDLQTVFKFARSSHGAVRNEFELFALKQLGRNTTCDVPRGLMSDPRSSWTALSFLAGEHKSYRELRAMSQTAQTELGTHIGEFAHELHSALDTTAINAKRQELKLDELDEAPWPVHFERTVRDGSFTSDQQRDVAVQIYDEWRAEMLKPLTHVVIHDDLHADNLLFRDDALVGVLDFGEMTIGSPEQELRHTFWMSDVVAHAAINTYEARSGTQINHDLVRLWSILQELAAYSEYSQQQRYDHPSFLRAQSSLARLLPATWVHE